MEALEKSMNKEFVWPDKNTILKKAFRWKRKKSDKKDNWENSGEFTLVPGESSGDAEHESSPSDSAEYPGDVGSG